MQVIHIGSGDGPPDGKPKWSIFHYAILEIEHV